jgi:hypothetical protein
VGLALAPFSPLSPLSSFTALTLTLTLTLTLVLLHLGLDGLARGARTDLFSPLLARFSVRAAARQGREESGSG